MFSYILPPKDNMKAPYKVNEFIINYKKKTPIQNVRLDNVYLGMMNEIKPMKQTTYTIDTNKDMLLKNITPQTIKNQIVSNPFDVLGFKDKYINQYRQPNEAFYKFKLGNKSETDFLIDRLQTENGTPNEYNELVREMNNDKSLDTIKSEDMELYTKPKSYETFKDSREKFLDEFEKHLSRNNTEKEIKDVITEEPKIKQTKSKPIVIQPAFKEEEKKEEKYKTPKQKKGRSADTIIKSITKNYIEPYDKELDDINELISKDKEKFLKEKEEKDDDEEEIKIESDKYRKRDMELGLLNYQVKNYLTEEQKEELKKEFSIIEKNLEEAREKKEKYGTKSRKNELYNYEIKKLNDLIKTNLHLEKNSKNPFKSSYSLTTIKRDLQKILK